MQIRNQICAAMPLSNRLMMAFGLMLLSSALAVKSLGLPFNLTSADPLIGLVMGIGLGFELLALRQFTKRFF